MTQSDETWARKFIEKQQDNGEWVDDTQLMVLGIQHGRESEQKRIWENVVLRDTIINGWEHPLDLNKDTILLRDLKRIVFGEVGK